MKTLITALAISGSFIFGGCEKNIQIKTFQNINSNLIKDFNNDGVNDTAIHTLNYLDNLFLNENYFLILSNKDNNFTKYTKCGFEQGDKFSSLVLIYKSECKDSIFAYNVNELTGDRLN